MQLVVNKQKTLSGKANKVINQQVGNKLKQIYADIVAEPVPDRLIDLLDQLESNNNIDDEPKRSDDQKDKA